MTATRTTMTALDGTTRAVAGIDGGSAMARRGRDAALAVIAAALLILIAL